jgi:hypothetical protein
VTDHEPWSAVREKFRLAKGDPQREYEARLAMWAYRLRRIQRMAEEARKSA